VCRQIPTTVIPTAGNIQAFFKDIKAITGTSTNKPTPKSKAAGVDVFHLPVSPDLQRLTKTQRLFSISTRTDIQSLTILGDIEFFLFMEMRAERGWASFKMTSQRWVTETTEFNLRLEKKNEAENRQTIKKNPRALLDKLLAIEVKVLERIAMNNYKCECSYLILILR
jgi:hypothetical protein